MDEKSYLHRIPHKPGSDVRRIKSGIEQPELKTFLNIGDEVTVTLEGGASIEGGWKIKGFSYRPLPGGGNYWAGHVEKIEGETRLDKYVPVTKLEELNTGYRR